MDEKDIDNVSRHLGYYWRQLGIIMGYSDGELDNMDEDCRTEKKFFINDLKNFGTEIIANNYNFIIFACEANVCQVQHFQFRRKYAKTHPQLLTET